jgi:hypothetical protein
MNIPALTVWNIISPGRTLSFQSHTANLIYFYNDILTEFYDILTANSHLYLLLLYDLWTFWIPQCAHLLNLPSVWFVNWPDGGSMSQNMLRVLQIDNKLLVVFRLNIMILWYLYWITQQDGPNKKKLCIATAMMYHDILYILWLHYQKLYYYNAQ